MICNLYLIVTILNIHRKPFTEMNKIKKPLCAREDEIPAGRP